MGYPVAIRVRVGRQSNVEAVNQEEFLSGMVPVDQSDRVDHVSIISLALTPVAHLPRVHLSLTATSLHKTPPTS